MTAAAVWVNGVRGGSIDPADRGLTLGDGVFDTLTAFNGVPFAGERHLQRLCAQAAEIGIPLDPARVEAAWRTALAAADEPTILRTTVTRGASGRGLWPATPPEPTLIVSAAPWNAGLFGMPARLATSAIRRDPDSPSSRLKTLGYLDNVLAAREAETAGATDALLLNTAGHVACTTIANVFMLSGNSLRTPPVADGVLPGIMRELVLGEADRLGLMPAEQSLLPAALMEADAVFLTNSVRFLCPVQEIDGRALSAKGANAVAALRRAVAAQVEAACGFELLPAAPGGKAA